MPEITFDDEFGRAIYATIRSLGIRSFIEIGSWDGEGSTSVIAAALSQSPSPLLTCVEANPGRHAMLAARFAGVPWVSTVCDYSISRKAIGVRTFEEMWNSKYNRLAYQKEIVRQWWDEQPDTPRGFLERLGDETWDAALIDGGEFCGWEDYEALRPRVRVIMLDDVFRAYKCARAHDDLRARPEWECIWASAFVRNGASIWARTA